MLDCDDGSFRQVKRKLKASKICEIEATIVYTDKLLQVLISL